MDMKSKLLIITVLCAVMVAVFLLPAPVQAGSISKFRGDSADASFFTVDKTGCIYTDAFVFATEGKQQSPPGSPGTQRWADIYIYSYDTCSGEQLVAAFGSTGLGSGDFQIDNKLTAGSLNTTVNVYDYVSGTSYDVQVNLNWIGSGDLNRGRSSSSNQSGQCRYSYRWNGTWRYAEATGSISDGKTNYASGLSGYGNLQSVRSGDMVIGCN
jgi:hypothetical protein